MPKKSLSDHQRNIVYNLCEEEGLPQAKVAQLFDVSQGTVSNAVQQMRTAKKHADELAQRDAEIAKRDAILRDGITRAVQAEIEKGTIEVEPYAGLIDYNGD